MSHSQMRTRLAFAVLAAAIVATSGCSWFRENDAAYKRAKANAPLELPPELDRPSADPAMQIPSVGTSATASGTQRSAAAGASFTATGDVAEVWERIGSELDGMAGVEVLNRAQLLGTYEVRYQEQTFLIRTQSQAGGVLVSALGADGRALGSGPAATLLGELDERI
ncbi:hypothetical protein [Coralloluteibacterium stylophorae]|uniref:Outer membrane protein assembly factor BamC n=1 Tax=Coralloluteibacterium stylophorae TaxID=1776034 RepID=A0A8J8AZD4_9GAMM|nr:hypothetical protein [Coralloluteibacterium stylophorae]MBS7458708.1 hypothetical protein [Coralloluteibacterium stylophorae]